MRRDIDEALQGWPYDPEAGEVVARETRARDGRPLVQVRVELGILQMEAEGRPDGVRPHGFASYLDYLRHRAAGRGLAPGGKSPSWQMSAEQAAEADHEFAQFFHRRVAWLALNRYDRAQADADYVASHERFRGLVLFHRTQAAAALALERRKPDEAIDAVRDGAAKLAAHQEAWEAAHEGDETPNGALIEQLGLLEVEIRGKFAVEKTLREQLDEAVADEDYERAARLRDQIKARARR